jgi:predicted ABC-type transport system involved in lysophospholipase L1 biosynthesis ATPase subunit
MVIDVLLAAAEHSGAALVVSTHDTTVAERFPTRWRMHSGELAADEMRAPEHPRGSRKEESTWSR